MSGPLGKEPKSASKAGAGVAGAGGGTLLMILANSLPNDSPAKSIILFAAPSCSVALSAFWVWAQVKAANYFRDREVATIVAACKRTLSDALRDPNSSPAHHAEIRAKLEELENMIVERHFEKLRDLKILTEADMPKAGNA